MRDGMSWIRTGLSLTAVLVVAVSCSSSGEREIDDLSEAVASGDPDVVQEFADRAESLDEPLVFGLTPLMRAVNRDDLPVVQVLLDAGASVSTQGSAGLTPALLAARSDSASSLRLLLDAGADPGHRSANGMNALDHAADAGAVETIEVLLTETALDIDEPSHTVTPGHGYPRDLGPTPLGLAVRKGRLEAARTLLELGADVNASSASGHTPILLAVFFDVRPEIARLLIDSGADLEVRAECRSGCSVSTEPLSLREWAVALNRDRLLPLLER